MVTGADICIRQSPDSVAMTSVALGESLILSLPQFSQLQNGR